MPKTDKVLILNPTNDCRITSMNRARRYVKKGVAVWVKPDSSIKFIPIQATTAPKPLGRNSHRSSPTTRRVLWPAKFEITDAAHLQKVPSVDPTYLTTAYPISGYRKPLSKEIASGTGKYMTHDA